MTKSYGAKAAEKIAQTISKSTESKEDVNKPDLPSLAKKLADRRDELEEVK